MVGMYEKYTSIVEDLVARFCRLTVHAGRGDRKWTNAFHVKERGSICKQ